MHTPEIQMPHLGRRRGRYSNDFKRQVIAACLALGVSTAAIALSNGLNANLVRRWVVESSPRSDSGQSKTSTALAPARGNPGFVSVRLDPVSPASIDLALDAQSTSGPHIQSGKLRALGVTTAERAFFAPNVPATKEFVPGFEVKAWHGVMAPAGTHEKIVNKLSNEIQAFLRLPATEEKLRDRGVIRVRSTPVQARKMLQIKQQTIDIRRGLQAFLTLIFR